MHIKNSFKNLFFLIGTIWIVTNCTFPDKISPADYQKIQTGFLSPQDSNTVWCYWYWIGDDISKEGITKDLEAMKEVGIGAAFIGNINPKEVDGPVPMLSEEWWEHMVHAVNEGKRIGVDIGTFNCPGWSMSGGPWVKPEMAMRHLVFFETTISGTGQKRVKLETPIGEFQDTHVLAFPKIQAGKTKLTSINSNINITPRIDNTQALLDSDLSTVAFFKGRNEYSFELQ